MIARGRNAAERCEGAVAANAQVLRGAGRKHVAQRAQAHAGAVKHVNGAVVGGPRFRAQADVANALIENLNGYAVG